MPNCFPDGCPPLLMPGLFLCRCRILQLPLLTFLRFMSDHLSSWWELRDFCKNCFLTWLLLLPVLLLRFFRITYYRHRVVELLQHPLKVYELWLEIGSYLCCMFCLTWPSCFRVHCAYIHDLSVLVYIQLIVYAGYLKHYHLLPMFIQLSFRSQALTVKSTSIVSFWVGFLFVWVF